MSLLTPKVYGVLALATIFVGVLSLFQELGSRAQIATTAELSQKYLQSLFGLLLVTNLLLAGILILIAPMAANFFEQPELVLIMPVLSLQFIISSFAILSDAFIRRDLKFQKIAMIDVLVAVIASTVTLIFAWLDFGIWALVFGTLCGASVRSGGLLIAHPVMLMPSFDFRGLGETLRFGSSLTGQQLVWWAYTNVDRILIGRFLDAHALGIYSGASQLATMPLDKVGSALSALTFNGLARAKDDPATFQRYLLSSISLVGVFLFPAAIGICAVADELVPVIFGSRWGGMEIIIPILALSIPARSVVVPLIASLNSLGRPFESLKCTMATGVLFSSGVVLGIGYGLPGVSIGILVASLLSLGTTFFIAGGIVGISALSILDRVRGPLLSCLFMWVSVEISRQMLPFEFPSVLGLFSSMIVGATTYSGMLYLLDREGLQLARSLLPIRGQAK